MKQSVAVVRGFRKKRHTYKIIFIDQNLVEKLKILFQK